MIVIKLIIIIRIRIISKRIMTLKWMWMDPRMTPLPSNPTPLRWLGNSRYRYGSRAPSAYLSSNH